MSIDVKFAKNHVRVAGINFFTANAPGIELGTWGGKKTPLTQQNYLMVEGRVPATKLKIRKALELDVDSSTLNEQDIGADITVPGVGKLSAGVAAQQLKSQQLKLIKLEVLPKDLADAVNESPAVIEGFQRVGNEGRLVHQIIVALQAKSAALFTTAATLQASVSAGVFSVTAQAGAGSSGATTVAFDNCTIAYLLLDPKWDASQKKNWSRIVDWNDDQWSMN